ncbi:MBL fold metallo-hydrolase [Alteraurantiacibacter aquimixticola]|uniref:MBL fold metallo-hydrolase n=1 Tax=Alteraurantiacibacter aquimixticola TaxID=2489173 RepID=A0A4T3EWT7_9SPHN|nr:MBL fold metallo-hydrolase [Alteraurantiacibacter aquimixticola]TIX49026.1 MBL fold metallo-hydrolase [Alteraurantiacibacter aquimixticola]
MAKDTMMSWQVGDVKITRIVEIYNFTDNINMTMPDATAEEVIAMKWLHPHYATPEGLQRMNFQGFVVQTPDRNIVVDSCIGAGRERDFDVFCDLPEGFLEDLESLGITRHDVDTVMCTHLHFDHVGWNTYKDPETGEYKPTFPNAKYLFGAKEYKAWQEVIRHDGHHSDNHLVECVDPIVELGLAEFIEADHVIAPGVHCEPSHGHTPGHVHVCIESRGERAVITGDLMHHPMQCAMPHRHATFDMDKDSGKATRMGFVEKYKDSGVVVIGAHFFDPTAGHIETGDDGETWFHGLGL